MIARELGYKVTGSDTNVYPPMSTFLAAHGIEIIPNYDVAQLQPAPDLVVIGNAMSRGNPCVEYVLDNQLNYTSGPQWLHDHLLKDKMGAGGFRHARQNYHNRNVSVDFRPNGIDTGFNWRCCR